MAVSDYISISYLRECFDLDEATGILTWRERPREHFGSLRAWSIWNALYSGKQAGYPTLGYQIVQMTIEGRKPLNVRCHRIVFALLNDRWPAAGLDHINRNGLDNRPENLREATQRENLQNTGIRRNNTSGYTGVHFEKRFGKWRARINIDGKEIYLGRFATPEAARDAYVEAKKKYHTFAPVVGGLDVVP